MPAHPEVRRRWQLAPDVTGVGPLRRAVSAFVAEHDGVPPDRLPDVTLAVGELVANAVRHGSPGGAGPVVVDALIDGRVEIVVRDHGPGLPSDVPVDQRHGLGIVHTVADRVALEGGADGGARVTVVFE